MDKLQVRTKIFPRCSPLMINFLTKIDGITISEKNRLQSVRDMLERNKDDPECRELLEDLLAGYGDVLEKK